jgi:fructose-1,6-bisphosphatase
VRFLLNRFNRFKMNQNIEKVLQKLREMGKTISRTVSNAEIKNEQRFKGTATNFHGLLSGNMQLFSLSCR